MSSHLEQQPGSTATTRMSYMDALVQAQMEELERDDRVVVMGEDIAIYGGGKLVERFGATRIWSMPISETSFTGVGIGAAISGLRPIVDVSIASFMYLASDQIINQASKLRYMTGGQIKVPIVFRCCIYYGAALAAQHSDRPYPLFMNVPGLKIISPSSPADMKGMLKSAIRDDDPVLVFEDTKLWPTKGDVPIDSSLLVPLGKAAIKRTGTDVTLVAIAGAIRPALEAAELLTKVGVSVEVLDPRTLKPLDMEAIMQSVAKTGRLVVIENAHRLCSVAGEISATVAEEGFDLLKRPIQRLTAPDVHVPFSPTLEALMYPSRDAIINAVKKIV